MSKDIPLKLIIGALSNEKGVSQEVIFQALEAALVSATKKKYGPDIEAEVIIDRKSGSYVTTRLWEVVDDETAETDDYKEAVMLPLSQAQAHNPTITVGETLKTPLENVEFGRIAAQTAKGVMAQKMREAERAERVREYLSRVGQIISGTAKRVSSNAIYIDLGNNTEALLRKEDLLPREVIRVNDRVRAYLMEVAADAKGPQVLLSRAHPGMLEALFRIEVPEVSEGIIEIKAVARDPGVRAKIAVKTNDGRIDAVGACVGMRGARVQAVSNELNGERVDIITWDDNPAQLVMNAMAPAEVVSIVVDEDTHVMDVAVSEAHLSQAIGRAGQNVRLASELTGWELNVISDKQALAQNQAEQDKIRAQFQEHLFADEACIDALLEEGFTSLEEVAYVPIQELLEIEGFELEMVTELRQRAKDALVMQAIAQESQEEGSKGLMQMPGMTQALVEVLAGHDIKTQDDLAELSVDDLTTLTELDEQAAAALIMQARAHWFDNE